MKYNVEISGVQYLTVDARSEAEAKVLAEKQVREEGCFHSFSVFIYSPITPEKETQ